MRNSCPPEDWCRSHKNHKIWAKLPNPQVRKPNNPKAATERETRRFGQCDLWIFQEWYPSRGVIWNLLQNPHAFLEHAEKRYPIELGQPLFEMSEKR